MNNSNSYRLWIYGRDELHDPQFIKDLIDLGIKPFVANANTKVAYCLGLCILTKGTLEQMERMHDALAAKGYRSRIDFRDTPHPNSTIRWEDGD